MALDTVLEQVTIQQVFDALEPGHIHPRNQTKAQAFWRSSKDYNIRLYQHQGKPGIWIDPVDHTEEEFPGILGLIRMIRGGTKAEAVRWIETEVLGLNTGSEAPKQDPLLASAKRWREAVVTVKEYLIGRRDQSKLEILASLQARQVECRCVWQITGETIETGCACEWSPYEAACAEQKRLRSEIRSLQTLDGKQLVERYHAQDARTISSTLARAEVIHRDRQWSAGLLEHAVDALARQQKESVEVLRCFGNQLYRERSVLFPVLVKELLRFERFAAERQARRFHGTYGDFLEIESKRQAAIASRFGVSGEASNHVQAA